MKYSLNWIKKLVKLPENYQITELKSALWDSLAEIEKVEEIGVLYKGVVIALIKKIEKHPKSDHLLITTIDVGTNEDVTVITGAPNVKPGQYVPYLPVGCTVPRTQLEGEKVTLQPKDMLGVVSYGMLASKYELNLGDDHSGIMIINSEELETVLTPGQDFAQALGLDDVLIEIENKSMTHRGDCFSIVGAAREVSAITNSKFVEPEWLEPTMDQVELYAEEFDTKFKNKVLVDLQAEDIVPRYSIVLLENITIGESPLWLQLVLLKHGIKPINNVVDITNYIMLEWGQPLHAFDASTVDHTTKNGITEYNIVVRKSQAGEKIFALDNKEHVLEANSLVIADPKKILGIAGIIGGAESAISGNTTKVLLEAATFDMYSVRRTTMQQGVFTDAGMIFSRKQDPSKTVKAMLRAIDFLQNYAGAEIASPITDKKNYEENLNKMVISPEKARAFIGVEISDADMEDILKRLNYEVKRKGQDFELVVPSYRQDVVIDEDVYEDIIRIYGYSKINPQLPTRPIYPVRQTQEERVVKKIRQMLTSLGMYETMNFSFVSEALYNKCLIDVNDCFKIINAVSPDVQYYRKLIAPELLQQATNNQYNGAHFGIFEFGHTARKGYLYGKSHRDLAYAGATQYAKDDFNLPIEDKHLSAVVVSDSSMPVYYELKQYIDAMLGSIVKGAIHYVHESELPPKILTSLPMWIVDLQKMTKGGRTAIIVAEYSGEQQVLGIIGEVNLICKRNLGLQKNAVICEMNLPQIVTLYLGDMKHREPSVYPAVQLDYTFEVSAETKYESLISELRDESTKHLIEDEPIVNDIQLVDIFSKNADSKRVTLRITYQSFIKTLRDVEVKSVESKLVTRVDESLKGKLV